MKNNNNDKHSIVGPSTVERVVECPTSVYLTESLPHVDTEESSVYAKEGTKFHEYMEQFINEMLTNLCIIHTKEWYLNSLDDDDKTMIEYIYDALLYVHDLITVLTVDKRGTIINSFVEHKLKIFYSSKDFGTLDFGLVYKLPNEDPNIINDWKTYICILDWKYGQGVLVQARDNLQLISYAYSLVKELNLKTSDIEAVTTVIYQPRLADENGKIVRGYSYNARDLELRTIDIQERVSLAYKILKNPTKNNLSKNCNPDDDTCRFCKAKGICRAYSMYKLGSYSDDIENSVKELGVSLQDLPDKIKDVVALSNEELAKVVKFGLETLPLLEDYIKNCTLQALNLLETGTKLPNLSLDYTKPRQKWIDDEEAIADALLEVDINAYKEEPSLKSITEITKLLKKINRLDIIKDLTVVPEGTAKVILSNDDGLSNSIPIQLDHTKLLDDIKN